MKFDSVGRLGGITVSTVETTAITKDESFGAPAVSVATFLTREPTSKITTDGFRPPLRFSLFLQECERQLLFAHRIQEGFEYDIVEE